MQNPTGLQVYKFKHESLNIPDLPLSIKFCSRALFARFITRQPDYWLFVLSL